MWILLPPDLSVIEMHYIAIGIIPAGVSLRLSLRASRGWRWPRVALRLVCWGSPTRRSRPASGTRWTYGISVPGYSVLKRPISPHPAQKSPPNPPPPTPSGVSNVGGLQRPGAAPYGGGKWDQKLFLPRGPHTSCSAVRLEGRARLSE